MPAIITVVIQLSLSYLKLNSTNKLAVKTKENTTTGLSINQINVKLDRNILNPT